VSRHTTGEEEEAQDGEDEALISAADEHVGNEAEGQNFDVGRLFFLVAATATLLLTSLFLRWLYHSKHALVRDPDRQCSWLLHHDALFMLLCASTGLHGCCSGHVMLRRSWLLGSCSRQESAKGTVQSSVCSRRST